MRDSHAWIRSFVVQICLLAAGTAGCSFVESSKSSSKSSESSSDILSSPFTSSSASSSPENVYREEVKDFTSSYVKLRGPILLVLALVTFLPSRPQEKGAGFLVPDLVEVAAYDSTIKLNIRYATRNNFMGRPMYQQARAFLQRPAAEALVLVHRRLMAKGFGLLVFDGYRPWAVTKKFWDETSPEKRKYVADPAVGSRHNRGCAVDLSMFSLASGREVEMPSAYDEFSVRAYPDYRGGTDESRRLRDLLRRAMALFFASA